MISRRMSTAITSSATSWLRRAMVVAAVSAAWLTAWLVAPPVSAHAAYVSSSPEFAEVLDESPSEISIRFSQELFRREGANALWVEPTRDDDTPQDPLRVEIKNADRHVMRGTLDFELRPGRYIVSWRNLSAEDGDEDRGQFPFYVGIKPDESEVGYDRELAAALLIAYPDDEAAVDESEPSTSAPTVVRVEDDQSDAQVSTGWIAFLLVGLLAALVLLAALLRGSSRFEVRDQL